MPYNFGVVTHKSQSKKELKSNLMTTTKNGTICDRPRFRISAEYI